MSNIKVLCLTGFSECGKSTAGEFLSKSNFYRLKCSKLLYEKAVREVPECVDKSIWSTIKNLEKKFGKQGLSEQLVHELINRIQGTEHNYYVVDSVASLPVVNRLRESFGKENVKILALLSSEKTRLERCRTEGEREQLLLKDAGKELWGLKELITNADYTLDNEVSLDSFISNLDKVANIFKEER